jgi:hypothetical protein
MPKSKATIALVIIVVIILAGFALYAGLTYPRTILTIPVSFSVGADEKTVVFDQPFLDDKTQAQVTIENGAALWQAKITSQNQVVWEHTAGQGGQTNYDSGWMQLSNGSYNFTFTTVGIGSLEAVVTVTSKGGFW